MKNSILFIISGIVIYGLFALCYGPIPMLWEDPAKIVFIALEILFPVFGYVFNEVNEIAYDLRKIRDLENEVEELIKKYKVCQS